ncbi:LacI family DNA-binding transcriptional regulator [Rubellicoccus peritrichatus]|uniref:LacI family DNA-binding transcriptional regulator n=1 Tax=Rubellicoccus peritrichatus TaxID=3080537 RepID=A0AAQ3QSF2_9BACT|nr:LacI family DNA-binding transcriptional regulator [Puniceicoccus sp. CR14]WOO40291.1 LacI family DNA-binding transcriptional regulator [Puniceicoccus sp. CR14]
MSFGKRVTQKDVALRANVSRSAVSLALRNDPRLPGKTIEHIQKIATEMGYAPDPWLASLSSYRRSDYPRDLNMTIAMVTNWETKGAWRNQSINLHYYEGAKEMAAQLGYKIEEFWIKEHGGENRTASILYNRGIKGILLIPMPPDVHTLDFDFSKFSVVQVGRTLNWPIVNTVAYDHYNAMHQIVFILRVMGYRRIGFAAAKRENKRNESTWLASFLAKQYDFTSEMAQIPIHRPEKLEKEPFLNWFQENQCDVIISNDLRLYQYLKDAGYRIPDDVAFSCQCLDTAENVAGIYMDYKVAGAHAISFLHMMMMRDQRGCPKDPIRHLVEGSWHDGKTVLNRNKPMSD